jgi:hypothetical protein
VKTLSSCAMCELRSMSSEQWRYSAFNQLNLISREWIFTSNILVRIHPADTKGCTVGSI